MSLTNPNTVVTEQRLNDFYKGILPYLGGMPEMVANKFSKGDLYSTDEKMIGQWIDGKPLYQKVITFTTPSSTTNTKVGTISSGADVKTMIGYVHETSNNIHVSINWCIPDDSITNSHNYLCVYALGTDLYVVMGSGSSMYYRKPAYLIVQYTKTTDSPILIGDANDYSTEEKIIGTWVDGKPIYQKTITYSWNMQYATPYHYQVPSQVPANMDTIIDAVFVATEVVNSSLSTAYITRPFYKDSSNYFTLNSDDMYMCLSNLSSTHYLTDLKCTFVYTKTTS